MTLKTLVTRLIAAWALTLSAAAQAVLIGGVEFPQGAASFADAVISYSPGIVATGPTEPYRGAVNALGVPNYTGANSCASQAACTFVSLGVGGSIVLQFVDNKLTGSDSAADDLWIFEIGPDVEDTRVDISKDGVTWSSVGAVTGSTRGVNIDAFGFSSADIFAFVRLTDVAELDGTTGATVGADIDAVGAITTVLTPVPEPGTFALLGVGIAGLLLGTRAAGRR